MADTSNLTNFLEDVADAIRAKKGTQAPISAASFDTEISSISTVNNQNKTVTENGVVTPDTGYTGLGEVTVNVDSIPDGIFIQADQPTKTTNEALWLKSEDRSSMKTTDILLNNLTGSDYTAVANILSAFTPEQLDGLNSCAYILFIYSNNQWEVIGRPAGPYWNSAYNYYEFYGTTYWGFGGMVRTNSNFTRKVVNTWISNRDITLQGGTIHKSDIIDNEPGIHIDVDNTRYLVHTNKSSSWNKILDTSNADATASDILTNKTAFVNNTKLIGTMPNNGTINITPGTTAQNIPAGYTSGGTVSGDANLVQANIKAGVTIFGIEGNLEPDKPDQDKTANPSISTQVIEPDIGYELASVTINPVTSSIDANITAENIKTNVTLQPGEMSHTDYITALELAENILGTGEYENTMNTLNSIDSSSDTYTGLGGTENEIEEIFDEIIGEGENE